MLINHPVLNRFSPAIREIEPQIGDDNLLVQNRFVLTGLPPEPTYPAAVSPGGTQESSFFMNSANSVTNAVGNLITVVTLRPGYWKLSLRVAYVSNFLGTDVNGDMRVSLNTVSTGREIMSAFSVVGTQQIEREIDLMLTQIHAINFFINTAGVGQSHSGLLSLVINKLL